MTLADERDLVYPAREMRHNRFNAWRWFSSRGFSGRVASYSMWLLLIAVPVAVLGVLYVWPVLHLFRLSLDRFEFDKGPIDALQVRTYWELLTDPYYMEILAYRPAERHHHTRVCAVRLSGQRLRGRQQGLAANTAGD